MISLPSRLDRGASALPQPSRWGRLLPTTTDDLILAGPRRRSFRAQWPAVAASLLLSWTFAAGNSMAQAGPGLPEDPEAESVAKEEPRPKLIRRWFGRKSPHETEVIPKPELRDLAPAAKPSSASTEVAKPPAVAPPVDPKVVPAQFAYQGGYSYENIGNVATGSQADLGFLRRLFNAYTDEPTEPEPPDPGAPPSRRGMDAPFQAPPMPFSDFIGPTIGVNDTSVFPLMDALYRGKNGQAWKDSRLKIYGWFDPSYNASTSRRPGKFRYPTRSSPTSSNSRKPF